MLNGSNFILIILNVLKTTTTGINVTGKTETDSLDVSGHAGIDKFFCCWYFYTFSNNVNNN